MAHDAPSSTERFSDRVASYVRARPGYPGQIPAHLARELKLAPGVVVADLGSGTGLSSEPFLRAGFTVIGVEPNAPMRAAGDAYLAQFGAPPARFSSVAGTAEATTLPAASVDLVIAGQAFHWFDVAACRAEARRILRAAPGAGRRAALMWNDRIDEGTPFAEGYERLLEDFGIDYRQIKHRHALEPSIEAFFGGATWRETRFANPTELDWDTLVERLNSASYVPKPDAPTYAPMLAQLRRLYDAGAAGGRVRMDYTTRVFHGVLAD
jgi:SAM-dependent methyltransferase